jgi:hypothetical protein
MARSRSGVSLALAAFVVFTVGTVCLSGRLGGSARAAEEMPVPLPTYKITFLDQGANDNYGWAINDHGVAVGLDIAPGAIPRAARFKDGKTTVFPPPAGFVQSFASDITNQDLWVGFARKPTGETVGLVGLPNGSVQMINPPAGGRQLFLQRVNENHRAVGGANGPILVDLTRTPYTPVALPTDGRPGVANDINGANKTVGSIFGARGLPQGTLWGASGPGMSLPLLAGTVGSEPYAIDDLGNIGGAVLRSEGGRVPAEWLWRGPALSDPHLLATVAGYPFGEVYAKSEAGVCVGSLSRDLQGQQRIAMAHYPNGAVVDLNTRIPADANYKAWEAMGINRRGQIVVNGDHKGRVKGAVLTPFGPPVGAADIPRLCDEIEAIAAMVREHRSALAAIDGDSLPQAMLLYLQLACAALKEGETGSAGHAIFGFVNRVRDVVRRLPDGPLPEALEKLEGQARLIGLPLSPHLFFPI